MSGSVLRVESRSGIDRSDAYLPLFGEPPPPPYHWYDTAQWRAEQLAPRVWEWPADPVTTTVDLPDSMPSQFWDDGCPVQADPGARCEWVLVHPLQIDVGDVVMFRVPRVCDMVRPLVVRTIRRSWQRPNIHESYLYRPRPHLSVYASGASTTSLVAFAEENVDPHWRAHRVVIRAQPVRPVGST